MWFQQRQLASMSGTPYQFHHFKQTNGYANLPLDGLWPRGPYLHNGSVPTLADPLKRPVERPTAFVRGLDVVDPVNGGFSHPPVIRRRRGECFDTTKPGNGSGGHEYGVGLSASEKADLLAYRSRSKLGVEHLRSSWRDPIRAKSHQFGSVSAAQSMSASLRKALSGQDDDWPPPRAAECRPP